MGVHTCKKDRWMRDAFFLLWAGPPWPGEADWFVGESAGHRLALGWLRQPPSQRKPDIIRWLAESTD